jgi:hypothetical protein
LELRLHTAPSGRIEPSFLRKRRAVQGNVVDKTDVSSGHLRLSPVVLRGLVPRIHVFVLASEGVDGRVEPGQDETEELPEQSCAKAATQSKRRTVTLDPRFRGGDEGMVRSDRIML